VKCPKCKEIFTAAPEDVSVAPGNEPKKESVTETLEQRIDSGSSAGMTAQDEASLEEELAKIFDDMKKSTAEQEDEGEGPLSEEDLQSQLEDILDERCSVCGTIVGKSTKHELYGQVFCTNCLPETAEGEEAARHLTVSGQKETAKEAGGLRKLGAVLAGLVILGLIVFAGYYIVQM